MGFPMRILLSYLIVLTVFLSVGAARAAETFETPAKQAIMLDFDTGAVLMEKNADERMTPSSMSKEMTMYLVFEALKNGKLTLEQTLPISERAWRMQGSKMFVAINSQVKVEDLVRGVIIQSGNDAAIALAEGIGGTEDNFALMLNKKAEELGMKNSHFMNASGWPDPQHYSTARDLSILAYHMIQDFPEYYHYYSEKEFTYNNIKQGNRNPLLYRNIGADGIKTGHTDEGGYGLIGSGKLGDRRVIFVVNGLSSMQERADESARLLEWGLKTFENVAVFKAGDVVEQAQVVMGLKESVPLTIEKDVKATLPTSVRNDLKVELVYNGPLEAPVTKGQEVGMLKIEVPRMGAQEVPVVAAEDVGRIGLFAETVAKLKILASGKHE
jgi:D-alanyl-D-alanine carboxypeptidase (penicillin-binding protein 5/6)